MAQRTGAYRRAGLSCCKIVEAEKDVTFKVLFNSLIALLLLLLILAIAGLIPWYAVFVPILGLLLLIASGIAVVVFFLLFLACMALLLDNA